MSLNQKKLQFHFRNVTSPFSFFFFPFFSFFFSRVHATLQPAPSVGPSVGLSISPSFGPLVGNTLLFFVFLGRLELF